MTFFLLLLVLEDVVDLHRTGQVQLFLGTTSWGIDLDFCDVESFVLERN